MMWAERRIVMSIPIDPGKPWRMVDDAGQALGVVLSGEALQRLLAERDALRDEVSRLREERDEYLRVLAQHGLAFTAQELEELRRDGVPLDELIRQLEDSEDVQAKGA